MISLISDGLIRRIDELESHSFDEESHSFDEESHSFDERELRLNSLLRMHCRPHWRLIDSLKWWYNERLNNQMINGVLALAIEQAYVECDRHLPIELTKRILKQAFGF